MNTRPDPTDPELAARVRAGADAGATRTEREAGRAAGDLLLGRHAGLVRAALRSVRVPAHVGHDDLLQVGRIALLRAAKAWDPAHGAKLTTFATVCVRREMIRELDRGRNRPLPQADGDPDDAGAVDALPDDSAPDAPPVPPAIDPDALPRLLAALTPRQRAALTLWYGLGGAKPCKDARAVGRRLRCTPGQAERLRRQALDRLRDAARHTIG